MDSVLPERLAVNRLEGRRVQLRPVTPGDYDQLYWLSTQPETAFRWRFRGRTPPPEEFVSSLWENAFAQFVITPVDEGAIVGLVSGYGAHISRFAYFAAMVDPAWAGSGLGVEGIALFLDHVFRCWDFRKLYAEVPAFNLSQFESALGNVLVEEGRLLAHDYMDGAYHDLHILALYRERWSELSAIVERFCRPQ